MGIKIETLGVINMSAFTDILIQAGYYGLVMVITIAILSMMMRGFFWKYIKVRTSFGKYVMVKIRTKLRDYFVVGKMEEGFLIYKHKKEEYRLAINFKENQFYKCVGVMWVDIDEDKSAIALTDFSAVGSHDPRKWNEVLLRALFRPSISDNKQKIILIILIVLGIGILVIGYLEYHNYASLRTLNQYIYTFAEAAKGTVVGSTTV